MINFVNVFTNAFEQHGCTLTEEIFISMQVKFTENAGQGLNMNWMLFPKQQNLE